MAPDGNLRVIRNVELLAKSNFSFLRGASPPEELVNRADNLSIFAMFAPGGYIGWGTSGDICSLIIFSLNLRGHQ